MNNTPTPKNTAVKGLVGAAVCVTNVMATHYLVTKEKGEEIEDGGTPATTIACAAAYGFAFGLQCAAGTAKREGVQGR